MGDLNLGGLSHKNWTDEVLAIACLKECHTDFQDEAGRKKGQNNLSGCFNLVSLMVAFVDEIIVELRLFK